MQDSQFVTELQTAGQGSRQPNAGVVAVFLNSNDLERRMR